MATWGNLGPWDNDPLIGPREPRRIAPGDGNGGRRALHRRGGQTQSCESSSAIDSSETVEASEGHVAHDEAPSEEAEPKGLATSDMPSIPRRAQRDGALNAIAARVRILERQDHMGDEMVSHMLLAARRAPDILDAHMCATHHSLNAALRGAGDMQLLTPSVAAKLHRVGRAVNILRHIRRYSVNKSIQDLLVDLGRGHVRGTPAASSAAASRNQNLCAHDGFAEFSDISQATEVGVQTALSAPSCFDIVAMWPHSSGVSKPAFSRGYSVVSAPTSSGHQHGAEASQRPSEARHEALGQQVERDEARAQPEPVRHCGADVLGPSRDEALAEAQPVVVNTCAPPISQVPLSTRTLFHTAHPQAYPGAIFSTASWSSPYSSLAIGIGEAYAAATASPPRLVLRLGPALRRRLGRGVRPGMLHQRRLQWPKLRRGHTSRSVTRSRSAWRASPPQNFDLMERVIVYFSRGDQCFCRSNLDQQLVVYGYRNNFIKKQIEQVFATDLMHFTLERRKLDLVFVPPRELRAPKKKSRNSAQKQKRSTRAPAAQEATASLSAPSRSSQDLAVAPPPWRPTLRRRRPRRSRVRALPTRPDQHKRTPP